MVPFLVKLLITDDKYSGSTTTRRLPLVVDIFAVGCLFVFVWEWGVERENNHGDARFLVGPAVRHDDLSFCFVYKFRQRFGVVADAIARGLGMDTTDAVAECRDMNMFMGDLPCCKAACGESC